ncbi:MAG: PrsW family glutamic-type intramembrane protease [Salinivirgaceae bacterium]|jgi:RsiW-degrading membrane proteinase PrsW (M82 family)|nr:PrsW family glutamic-type intramembrane protease [Salinivirgaceae bacterium]
MINLLLISVAPVFVILAYIYYRDKYEKEPLSLLLEGLLAGGVIVLPIVYFEQLIDPIGYDFGQIPSAVWTAFMVAALVEEAFKFFAVYILIWRNPNFNERFDGIVYAVFVSLGFALVENVMYVFGNPDGLRVGLSRAITAVPAHAIFGIMMGYWLGFAKFIPSKRVVYMISAFAYPFLFHGIYDFILMSRHKILLMLFAPFLVYMYIRGRKRMKQLDGKSIFNPDIAG